MTLQTQVNQLFDRQIEVWEECRQRYADLRNARTKECVVEGCAYRLMFNPARMRSATATVGTKPIERPCFLCSNALPKEQMVLEIRTSLSNHRYNLLVNPFPIVDHHFTIVAETHTPQSFQGRHWDMAYLADQLPDYLIFFNGAQSGASAPDHLHFQAVPKRLVPILQWDIEARLALGVTKTIPVIEDSDQKNIVCWTEGEEAYWLVVDRKQHRPWQYNATGEQQLLISPASLEFCGLIPLAREEDFEKMTPALLHDVLAQCERREPLIHVGIMEGTQIRFSADEREHALNYRGEDRMLDVMDYGSNRAEKQEISEFWSHAEPFTLEGVTIGKQFHWEKQETQVFRGSLHVIAREGELHAINVVPLEEYLKSVISSEMSATNNLDLLKAHAIISRSWALRQMANSGQAAVGFPDDALIRWWDHEDHTLYDVCADDHCQRYQGITREVSPLVAQAIDETRGMVLTDVDGNICDARFSKCCGGRSERFSTCWQEEDYAYLQPVDDPWCNPDNMGETPEERNLVLKLVLNDYDQTTEDFHYWRVSYSQQELSRLIEVKLHRQLGLIQDLIPLKRGASGRISLLRIVGKNGSIEIGKELQIRKVLSETHLYSSWFDVQKRTAGEGDVVFDLVGHGWGHGVGLCQIGAANMSRHGKNYEEILAHYFIGSRLTRIY